MQAFLLPGSDGQRFCLYHPPRGGEARGAIIYLHPFAEEMNKARRMAALQARALGEAGYAVLQIDLLGCGDSAGDFADATWAAWKADVALARNWLRTQTGAPLTLWGLRTGCLLASVAAAELPEAVGFVFWQPVVSGKQFWQQFLRLKMAAGLGAGEHKGVTARLRQSLASGVPIEIAGYAVSPEMAVELEGAELSPPPGRAGRLAWFEVSLRATAALSPVAQKCIERWRGGGFEVDARLVHGPAFWQTTEIEEAPELLAATQAALEPAS